MSFMGPTHLRPTYAVTWCGDLSQSNRARKHALGELQDLNRMLEMRAEERTRANETVNRRLERLALSDALTDLPNPTLFMDRLRQTLNGAKRKSGRFAVC